MIRTVGVTQVKYCYRMNTISAAQIQFIQYAFHSNQLQAETAHKWPAIVTNHILGLFRPFLP